MGKRAGYVMNAQELESEILAWTLFTVNTAAKSTGPRAPSFRPLMLRVNVHVNMKQFIKPQLNNNNMGANTMIGWF